jgi:hypothetical protein
MVQKLKQYYLYIIYALAMAVVAYLAMLANGVS